MILSQFCCKMPYKIRSFIGFVVILLDIVQNEAFYRVTKIRKKFPQGCSFQSTSETTIGNCFAKCLENCTCRAFWMFDKDKTCSLYLSHNISLKMEDKMEGCSYFIFERNQKPGCKNGAMKDCFQNTNCCLTSQPCLNSGVCKPNYPSDILHSPRFTCHCAPGYHGNRCEQPMKSCRGYISGNHDQPVSGHYTIMDDKNQPFRVFCDFVKSADNVTVSWTLVQSYQLDEKEEFREPFSRDDPKNGTTPNWKSYRLSKASMHSIQNDSSKWRMTCRYEIDGLDKTDYMEGLKTQVDILIFNGGKCMNVEFINVRGNECHTNGSSKCQAWLIQRHNNNPVPFHHDSFRSHNANCSYNPSSIKCNHENNDNYPEDGEDNFGRYSNKCVNPAHRCSMSHLSTTQTWLGV